MVLIPGPAFSKTIGEAITSKLSRRIVLVPTIEKKHCLNCLLTGTTGGCRETIVEREKRVLLTLVHILLKRDHENWKLSNESFFAL